MRFEVIFLWSWSKKNIQDTTGHQYHQNCKKLNSSWKLYWISKYDIYLRSRSIAKEFLKSQTIAYLETKKSKYDHYINRYNGWEERKNILIVYSNKDWTHMTSSNWNEIERQNFVTSNIPPQRIGWYTMDSQRKQK